MSVLRPYHALMVILLTVTLNGCQLLQSFLQQAGEPASATDAVPPPDYRPIYVRQIGQFSPKAEDAAVQITRIETANPSRIRMYLHVVDSSGTYLSGAASGDIRKWWCGFTEEIEDISREVTDFTLREVTEKDREPHAIALVMDHSGSMGETRAFAVQDAADDLIRSKKPEDALALVKYDGKVVVEAPATTNNDALRNALKKNGLAGFGGMTAVGDGIAAGIRQVSSMPGVQRKAVIVFTDGQDNQSTISRDSVISLARQNDVIVCAVDFGTNTNFDYLPQIAVGTGGAYYQMYRTDEFDDVFEDIYRRLRNYYVLEYTPLEYGLHTIRLKLCMERDSLTTVGSFDNTPDIGTIALLNVHFDVAKADIKPQSKPAIDNVFRLMRTYPTLKIELRGHTDSTNSTGDPDFNKKLSQQRAEAVKDALVQRGITGDRITAIGFGESRPVADNKTPEGRALNRRTEFVIVER